jgi:hypothetical protein
MKSPAKFVPQASFWLTEICQVRAVFKGLNEGGVVPVPNVRGGVEPAPPAI